MALTRLTKGKEQREAVKQNKELLLEFSKKPDVVSLLSNYKRSLQHIFKHFARQDDVELNSSLPSKLNTINFEKFKKFCSCFRIVPDILPADDMITLFKQSTAYKMPPLETDQKAQSFAEREALGLEYDVKQKLKKV